MRKFTEIKGNIYTPKVYDIILPENVIQQPEESKLMSYSQLKIASAAKKYPEKK